MFYQLFPRPGWSLRRTLLHSPARVVSRCPSDRRPQSIYIVAPSLHARGCSSNFSQHRSPTTLTRIVFQSAKSFRYTVFIIIVVSDFNRPAPKHLQKCSWNVLKKNKNWLRTNSPFSKKKKNNFLVYWIRVKYHHPPRIVL